MSKPYYNQLFNLPILKTGIKKDTNLELKKNIFLVNTMCLLTLSTFFLAITIGLFFDKQLIQPVNLIALTICICLIIVALLFQHLGRYNWAKILFISTIFINCTVYNLYVIPGMQIEFYYIIPPLIALTIFDTLWIPVLFHFLGIVLFFDVLHLKHGIDYNQIHFMTWFFIIFFLVYFLKKINIKNEKLLALERDKVLSDKIILESQEIELRKINEFKSHFFVNLSHEIRTPLTLIQGYTNQLDFKTSDEENQQKVAVIKEQCQQMQDILNSIMDLSKMESNQFQLISAPVDINAFLEKHVVNFQSLFAKKNITLSFNNYTLNRFITIDESLFSKAITNLLSNALKFTPVNGRVSVNTLATKEGIKIDVIDTGIGIHENDCQSIFKRFYQIKNDITKSQGSGIGLAFTKSIIDAHNFSIEVKSVFGEGACFSIYIPGGYVEIEEINAVSDTVKIVKTPNKAPVDRPKKERILVVDDHEQMRIYLKKVLKNYAITEAENGEEALAILQNNSFDLIVTDYMMPVMDGETLVKQLKSEQNKTPIIVLTARTDQQGKLSMLRLGIDGYLHKPFIEEELLINVKNSIMLYKNVVEFDSGNSTEALKELNAYADKFNTKITAYINENINSPLLTVDAIAQYIGVSRSTLTRKVKSILGQTVNQLIQEARLERARNLRMEDPLASKKQIAEAVGVSNTTYLFEKLKERYGV